MSRILIVDDDQILVNTLGAILRRLGHSVLVALDGATGIACARAGAPDIIILDVMMPDMDGLEVCRALRAAPSTRETPVLMFTALREDELRRRPRRPWRTPLGEAPLGDQSLPDDYLVKPVVVGELLRRIEALLTMGDPHV